MNVTELTRRLKITTAQLYEHLPQMGFDVGRRAIKIDDTVAMKIIRSWSQYQSTIKKQREQEKDVAEITSRREEKKSILLPLVITVREFSSRTNLPVTKVIQTLMNNGILAALNEKIDFETAAILAEDLGFSVEKEEVVEGDVALFQKDIVKEALAQEDPKKLIPRPPVVVVMGHVDHGKTTLLDSIRTATVAKGEAGGITQHIGAYQLKKTMKKSGEERTITFIDTPGHEAFTTMRSRGAKVADIAILVVAADDGLRPQTHEAIKIIKAAELPMIVAINKIDKPGATIEKVKRELSDIGLIPEDWGGKTICVPISAKERIGIDDMLEMIILVNDLNKESIVANPQGKTLASVIESHVDKNEGVVATLLVQNGTLKLNEYLLIDNTLFGKARSLRDYRGKPLTAVMPSQPAKIIGLKNAPHVGSVITAVRVLPRDVEKTLKLNEVRHAVITPRHGEKKEGIAVVNLILKTDTLGSLEAIVTSLLGLEHPEIRFTIVGKELGTITSADVLTAHATGSFIAGFHVPISPSAAEIASEKGVEIKTYKIIYELLDDIKERMEKLLRPHMVRTEMGSARIRAVFRTETRSMIVGAVVLQGSLTSGIHATIERKGETIGEGKIVKLQSGKNQIEQVGGGQECGIEFQSKHALMIDDVIHAYKEDAMKRELKQHDGFQKD
ncbi:translation initiation factor IF-2 [Candidatus Uhrbacteria bacterium]|nr:translation initiation factor IF-2 [Candidatus Uhrbacteria bacterium]